MIFDGLSEGLGLVLRGDRLVYGALLRTLVISFSAVSCASLIGVPLGVALARGRFLGRQALLTLARAGMGIPTVFIGLVVYGLLSRRGLLGGAEMLYSPQAIVVGEFLLALPIVTALAQGAVSALDPRLDETARSLGAGQLQRLLTACSEARTGLLLAVLTALGRCMTELGIAMMVGGNIRERTRTLATAVAMETGRGDFGRGLAMGLVLVALALTLSVVVSSLAREDA